MEEKEKIKCPNCGKTNIEIKKRDVEVENEIAIPSKEPKTQFRCRDCGYKFGYAE